MRAHTPEAEAAAGDISPISLYISIYLPISPEAEAAAAHLAARGGGHEVVG